MQAFKQCIKRKNRLWCSRRRALERILKRLFKKTRLVILPLTRSENVSVQVGPDHGHQRRAGDIAVVPQSCQLRYRTLLGRVIAKSHKCGARSGCASTTRCANISSYEKRRMICKNNDQLVESGDHHLSSYDQLTKLSKGFKRNKIILHLKNSSVTIRKIAILS